MSKAVSTGSPTVVRTLGLILFLALSPVVVALEDVEQARTLLKKMVSANRELNYQGVFTYEHAGALKSIRITHVVADGLEYEKLQYLNGPRREILRSGVSPECRRLGDEFLKGVPMPTEFSSHLETSYELFLKGEDRVAGRNVRVIHVVPRDGMRYGYILSLDRETGLLLQSLLVAGNRRVMERFQYVDVSYQLASDLVAALVAPRQEQWPDTEFVSDGVCTAQTIQEVDWSARWLPPGFRQIQASIDETGDTAMVFTDGLSNVSVFVSPNKNPAFPPLQAQRGATVAQMTQVNHNGKEYQICVVGEVPPVTAEKIAASVAPK